MKGLTWQAVAVFLIAVAGAAVLYLAVPPDDPLRATLITAFNGAIGAATVYFLGRRQQQTDAKVDQVIDVQNAGEHPPSTDPRGGTPPPPAR